MQQSPLQEHQLAVTPIIIPPRTWPRGELSKILRQLADEGKTGDSFVTSKQPTTVSLMSRMLGLNITYRAVNPDERDKKKRKYRVWRTDGLEMDQVNQIIQDRLAGKSVPPTPPCVPLTGDAMLKAKGRRPVKKPPGF